MPNAATLGKTPAHPYDPLGPLADAIGSMTGTVSEKVDCVSLTPTVPLACNC